MQNQATLEIKIIQEENTRMKSNIEVMDNLISDLEDMKEVTRNIDAVFSQWTSNASGTVEEICGELIKSLTIPSTEDVEHDINTFKIYRYFIENNVKDNNLEISRLETESKFREDNMDLVKSIIVKVQDDCAGSHNKEMSNESRDCIEQVSK